MDCMTVGRLDYWKAGKMVELTAVLYVVWMAEMSAKKKDEAKAEKSAAPMVANWDAN